MNNKIIKKTDKTLQDDWIENSARQKGATSKNLPEYGGDLKRRSSIGKDAKKTRKR